MKWAFGVLGDPKTIESNGCRAKHNRCISKLPTSNCQRQTANLQFPIPNSKRPTPNLQFPTPNFQLPRSKLCRAGSAKPTRRALDLAVACGRYSVHASKSG